MIIKKNTLYKLFLLFCGIGILFNLDMYAQDYSIEQTDEHKDEAFHKVFETTLSYGLPVIVIYTEDEEMPTVEYVSHPVGCMGLGTANATKVPGRIERYEVDGNLSFTSGDYVKKESGMTIKIRGNTSAYRSQKPYKIKLQKEADLLNRGDNSFYDKNWALLADVGWCQWIGMKIAKQIQHQWGPDCEFVNVIFNGKYHGLYLLAETIERNNNARIKVDESGYIVEKDPYWWTEGEAYIQSVWSPSFNYTMKFPDYEDLADIQKSSIEVELNNLLNITKEGGYEDFIDLDSWVDFVLVHDFLGTDDGAGCNVYYVKYDSDSATKIGMGPAWDFDTASKAIDFSGTHTWEANFVNLYNNKDKNFIRKYIKRYDEVVDNINSLIESMLQDGPCEEDQLTKILNATSEVVEHNIHTHSQARNTFGKWFEEHRYLFASAVEKMRDYSEVENDLEYALDPDIRVVNNYVIAYGLMPSQRLEIFSIDGRLIHVQPADANGGSCIDIRNDIGTLIVRAGIKTKKIVAMNN